MFIVLEGIDGSGKSSLAKSLHLELPESIKLSEPTQGYWGKKIRCILSDKENDIKASNEKLLELFRKDRIWNNLEQIMPNLEHHNDIILDRSFFSTAAYQTYSQKQLSQVLEEYLSEKLVLKPDLLIYIDIPIGEALKRIKNRNMALEIFEKESELKRIKSNFEFIVKQTFDFKTLILDGMLNQEQLKYAALKEIEQLKTKGVKV